ncbi:hypothetical protein LIER_26241 [Lithospermum erythrorhizon]|uniref:GAG-pre-integrase domain-containing protein n=1 Tax=Lithospermum erythrorhizon TaxID=34254 RepID=A0AAV3R7W3_LITER
MPSLTPDQWHHLMSLFGNSNTPSANDRQIGKPFSWIFDSGATAHATGILEMCDIIFTHNLCFVQDRSAKKVIGASERRGGIYNFCELLVDSKASLLAIQMPELELWHNRLGHPSKAVLKSFPFICSSASVLNKSYETCHRAKHTRDVFFDNFKKATRCFELIHRDLWGPYSTPPSCGAKYFLTLFDDHSRDVWVVLLSNKTEVHDVFIKFIAMVKVCILISLSNVLWLMVYFFGLDEYMELGVGFAELVGASVEPASLAFDGTASPPRDGTASSPVEGTPSEASTPPDKAVVPPREAELGRGRRERAPPRHLQDYV